LNLILKCVRVVFYLCLPFLILSYGAVETSVHIPLFAGTTIITILCLVYWFARKELPSFSNKIVIPALILLSSVILQILSTLIANTTVSDGITLTNWNPLLPFSADIFSTCQSLAKTSSYICIVFCFITAFQSQKQKYHFLFYFCFIGFIISFFAIVKMVLQQYDLFNGAYYSRGFGPYINRNHYAGYINMVIPASGALIAISKERAKKILGLFFIVITTSSLFLSLSRGGILSMVFSGLVTSLILYKTKDTSYAKMRLLHGAGLFCVFLLVWWIGIDPVLLRLATIFHFPDEPGFIIRFWWSLDSLRVIRDFPLWGTGLGTLQYVFNAYKTDAHQYFVNFLHNDYFQFLVECGILGFSILLYYGYLYFKTVLSKITSKSSLSGQWRKLWIGSFASAMALSVHSLVDFNLHIPANCICFLLIISLPVDITRHTTAQKTFLSRNSTFLILFLVFQAFTTIVSIDLLNYERAVNKALRRSEFIVKHERLNDITNNRTCYAKGYYELGKVQFYKSLSINDTDLLLSSINNFNKAIRREPRNGKYYLRIGVARYVSAKLMKDNIAAGTLCNRALTDLHQAVKIERTNGMFWYFYGSYLIKNWYDFWDRGDEQFKGGVDALSAAVAFRPSYLPKSFEKILAIDNNYSTLHSLLKTVSSVKMLKSERLQRLITLHSFFANQLRKHMVEINFKTCSKSELLFSNENITMADRAMEQKKYEKALLLYEKVTKVPSTGENKIRAHAGIAASLRMF